jgi:hypothetical protein
VTALNLDGAATLVIIIVLAVLLNACGESALQGAGTGTPVVAQDVTRVDTLSQAESLLPFQVTLPSFLPAGVSHTPELLVRHDDDGRPEQLDALYLEEDTGSPGVSRLRIIELSGRSFLPDTLNFEVVDINGVSVQFATRLGGDLAEAAAAWSHEGIGYNVEFLWLSDEGTSDGEVTDQMRAEALKVIESIIE